MMFKKRLLPILLISLSLATTAWSVMAVTYGGGRDIGPIVPFFDTMAPPGSISLEGGTNAALLAAGWSTYSSPISGYDLGATTGTKSVFFQLRDGSGNTSEVYSKVITFETTDPTGSILVNGGAAATNTIEVTLTLSATDAVSGVESMRFNNDLGNWSTWESYATTKAWQLPSDEHPERFIYVEYRDRAGNTDQFSDTIAVDLSAPSGPQITATSPTNDATPTWSWVSGGGNSKYRLDRAGSLITTTEVSYTAPALSAGRHTLEVSVSDAAGNWSPLGTSEVLIDLTKPTGEVTIGGGASYSNSQYVDLTLTASDDRTPQANLLMRLANTESALLAGSWGGYYSPIYGYQLPNPTTNTIFYQLLDEAGNTSEVITKTITVDATGPTGSISINNDNPSVNTIEVTLTLLATDTGSGVDQMCFNNDMGDWSSWEAYATTKAWKLPAVAGLDHYVYVRFKDRAGNFADYWDSIYLSSLGGLSVVEQITAVFDLDKERDLVIKDSLTLGKLTWAKPAAPEEVNYYQVKIKTSDGLITRRADRTTTSDIFFIASRPERLITDYFKNGRYEGGIFAYDQAGEQYPVLTFSMNFSVPRPSIKEILADGLKLADNSRLSVNPELKAVVETAGPAIALDNNRTKILVDNKPVKTLSIQRVTPMTQSTGPTIFEVKSLSAPLIDGTHWVTVSLFDLSGNYYERSFANLSVMAGLTLSQLRGNNPNPFSPSRKVESTRIAYDLLEDADIEIIIFDITGRSVRKLTANVGEKTGLVCKGGARGYNEVVWDGKNESGNYVGNGAYPYIIFKKGEKKQLASSQIAVLD